MSALKHPNRVMAEVELISSHFGPVEFDGQMILVESFDLPPHFNKQASKLLIVLYDDYPETPPKDIYIEKELKKNGSAPDHYYQDAVGNNEIMDAGYAWYSIHFNHWNANSGSIIQGDNLLTAINALYDALKYDN